MKRPHEEESSSDAESDISINVGKEEECSQTSRSVSPTTTYQMQVRKRRRGIIEKRRRDRINSSLSELRRLVPTAFDKQGSSKLEKAEILQMTVDHLKMLRATRGTGLVDAQALAVDYRTLGFRECLTEVVRYLGILEGPCSSPDPVQLRLLAHLNSYVAEMEPHPEATAFLPSHPQPLPLLHKSTTVSTQVHVSRRGYAPRLAVLAASSLLYPGPGLRAIPFCQVPSAVKPACPNFLPNFMPSGIASSRKSGIASSRKSGIASSRRRRPPAVTSTTPSSTSDKSWKDAAPRSSQGSAVAAFLFSSSCSPASVPVTPDSMSPPASNCPTLQSGIRTGTAGLCHPWTADIGAF